MKTQTYRTTRVTTVATGTPKAAPLAPRKAGRPRKADAPKPPAAPKGMFEIIGDGPSVLVDAMVPREMALAMQALYAGWQV